MIEHKPSERPPNPETADVETSSDAYAGRFAGVTGQWMLAVQERIALAMLAASPDAAILDVGGGHGQLAVPLCRKGYRVTVLGSAESCRKRIVDVVADGRCQFLTGNVIELPFPDRSFDAAISFRLLTHCAAWPVLVKELCRVARQSVMVDYPTSEGMHAMAPALFGAKRKLEGNTRTWRPFRHDEVVAAFQQQGFVLESRVPEFFFPMALHRLLHCRGLSAAMEGFSRVMGLTGRWGSPVIVQMRRGLPHLLR